jgi:putative membrane protein
MAGPYSPNFIIRFLIRWLVCGLGLWITAGIFGKSISYDSISVIVIAGLLLAIVNAIIKPIVVILSLPAILFTLGLFMIVINGLMVMLVSVIYSPLDVASIWSAMLAGMVIGLVNYLVTTILENA